MTFQSVADRLRHNATKFPDKAALVSPSGVVTFREIDEETDALAAGLAAQGMRPGTRTIVMMSVGPDLVTVVLALVKVGAVPIVVDPGMGLRRILHCYRMVGASAFIGMPAMHLLRKLRPRTFSQVRLSITTGGRLPGVLSLREVSRPGGSPPERRIGPDDLMMIGFTTGSTGLAKGVEFTYGALDATVRTAGEAYGHTPDDVCLVTSMQFLFLHLLVGATSVLPRIDFRHVARADPAEIARVVGTYDVTAMFASPALLDRLNRHLSSAGHRLPSLRLVVSGGAPVSAEMIDGLRGVLSPGAHIHTSYGATEATPIASIESRELLALEGVGVCVGRPIGGTRVRVAECSDGPPLTCTDVPDGEVGEILVSGPVVSRRYLAPVDANARTKFLDGDVLWHRTGDVGRLDEQGRVWFWGRTDDIVMTDRGPLYPVPCETILNVHPAVYRTAVVRSPSGPVVCVELRAGVSSRAWAGIVEELRSLAREHEATRELTEFVRHRSFPVDPRHNAKIDRRALAEWVSRR
jgi:acyl-CoA synthetase (AMP-forming)/AMP-acid ligase II